MNKGIKKRQKKVIKRLTKITNEKIKTKILHSAKKSNKYKKIINIIIQISLKRQKKEKIQLLNNKDKDGGNKILQLV